MTPRISRRSMAALFCAALLVSAAAPSVAHADDLSANYDWKPVRLGAGGFVTGFVSHPRDANVRYCRTDVGNAYRWDAAAKEWIPMVVVGGSTGIAADAVAGPARIGVESIAVDPQDKNVVLMALPLRYSPDNKIPAVAGTVFLSTDGGRTFVRGDLNVAMQPNGDFRTGGECMGIDPNNGRIVYFGSRKNGLWKSVNGGLNWAQLTTGGAPAATANVIGIRFDRVDATHTTVYALVHTGPVLKSTDAGVTWANVSAASALGDAPRNSTVDSLGNLYVIKGGTKNIEKMTRAGVWSELSPRLAGPGHKLTNVAVDPKNPNRLFVSSNSGCVTRSIDGGASWTPLGEFYRFANAPGWLPQRVKGNDYGWRSNAGIYFDADARLWIPQGNEGMLTTMPSADNTETVAAPLLWTIDSKGIEEFVTHDVVLIPGSGDRAVVAMEDGSAFLIKNPDTFEATQATLQDQLISNGTGIAYCPNATNFVAVVTGDVHHTGSGKDYSGYSTDGGVTWTQFATRPPGALAGSIAISRREGWSTGADHIVWYPLNGKPPFWSVDGGATWTQGKGFPLKENGSFDGISGFWNGSLKQRALVADPFKADVYSLYTPWGGPGRFFRSVDGGRNWSLVADSNLPSGGHNAQLAANPYVAGDYWFVDGQEGATQHGLWHSTDGTTYVKMPDVDRAITLAIGKGTGTKGAVYFYGRLTSSPDWGVFRSMDDGATWDRISRYPAGQIDMPTCMAASQDTLGLVYIGFTGNSFVYGKPEGAR
ncbi:MAG: sialidase family protein [Opitutaceae bacterium]|jgi:photosystem II stability/assembly factor-like uncharacterized protein